MKWLLRLIRGRRVYLGEYEAPETFELSPLDDIVEEGVLIAASAARMTVRNQAVVRVLRDREDVGFSWYRSALAEQLLLLAEEKAEDVERAHRELQRERDQPTPVTWDSTTPMTELERLERRHAMLGGLVARLRALAEDPTYLDGLAASVRTTVLDEVGGAIRLSALRTAVVEELGEEDRAAAIDDLRSLLDGLAPPAD